MTDIKFNDLTNRKFGKLTVKKLHHEKQCFSKNGKKKGILRYWLCECECGKVKVIRTSSLTSGHTKSCGCLYSTQNNQSHSRLYKILDGMKGRCYYSKNNRFRYYGAKGITICDEWLDDFKNFYKWAITNGYRDDLTIDRIDVNGNYEPSNCRWVDARKQARNKSDNRLLTYKNQTLCVSEWCVLFGLKYGTLISRIKRGWSVEKALTTPIFQKANGEDVLMPITNEEV